MKFRTLKSDEIDVRVGTINEEGATLLLYKDARADMQLLDEAGVKWKREHQTINNNNLFCTVSIWDNDIQQWVSRQDVGVESQAEATKGEASDSFKRACFNWGIGRELYSAPFTWISSDKYTSFKNPKTGKLGTYDKFSVSHIAYDEESREIIQLVVSNDKTNREVFTWTASKNTPTTAPKAPQATPKPKGDDELTRAKKAINAELERQGITASAAKKAKIVSIIKKSTIDTIDDANIVIDNLKDEQ